MFYLLVYTTVTIGVYTIWWSCKWLLCVWNNNWKGKLYLLWIKWLFEWTFVVIEHFQSWKIKYFTVKICIKYWTLNMLLDVQSSPGKINFNNLISIQICRLHAVLKFVDCFNWFIETQISCLSWKYCYPTYPFRWFTVEVKMSYIFLMKIAVSRFKHINLVTVLMQFRKIHNLFRFFVLIKQLQY